MNGVHYIATVWTEAADGRIQRRIVDARAASTDAFKTDVESQMRMAGLFPDTRVTFGPVGVAKYK